MSIKESTSPWNRMVKNPAHPITRGDKHDQLCISITKDWYPTPATSCWCRCPKCWDAPKQRCICRYCPCPLSREGLGPVFTEGSLLPPSDRPSQRTAGRAAPAARPRTRSSAKTSGKPSQDGDDTTGRYKRQRHGHHNKPRAK